MNDVFDLMLASQSPRRRELLAQIGVRFGVLRVNVPEVLQPNEDPHSYVERLARAKARAGAQQSVTAPVLGADTVVISRGRVLEKPADQQTAMNMLAELSGSTHTVVTAVALCNEHEEASLVCESLVTFRSISAEEAQRYWLTGEPQDKAGGYGIQGLGAVFVERITGSYSNVVGLPLFETHQLLSRFDVPVWKDLPSE